MTSKGTRYLLIICAIVDSANWTAWTTVANTTHSNNILVKTSGLSCKTMQHHEAHAKNSNKIWLSKPYIFLFIISLIEKKSRQFPKWIKQCPDQESNSRPVAGTEEFGFYHMLFKKKFTDWVVSAKVVQVDNLADCSHGTQNVFGLTIPLFKSISLFKKCFQNFNKLIFR